MPLSSPADAVGRIAASMQGLDGRLSAIADSGKGNRDALASDSTALGELADSTQALGVRLGSGVGQGSFADVQQVIAVTLLAFAAWSFVPAVGALVLGVWLRRELVSLLGIPRSDSRFPSPDGGRDRGQA